MLLKENKPDAILNIKSLLQDELDRTDFNNKNDEDDSYNFVIEQIDIYYRNKSIDDNSLTLQDLAKIINIIENDKKTLYVVYNEALNYIENIENK